MMTVDVMAVATVLLINVFLFLMVIFSFMIGVGSTHPGVFIIAVILQFVADSLMRYCMMRSGYYPGLFPVKDLEAR